MNGKRTRKKYNSVFPTGLYKLKQQKLIQQQEEEKEKKFLSIEHSVKLRAALRFTLLLFLLIAFLVITFNGRANLFFTDQILLKGNKSLIIKAQKCFINIYDKGEPDLENFHLADPISTSGDLLVAYSIPKGNSNSKVEYDSNTGKFVFLNEDVSYKNCQIDIVVNTDSAYTLDLFELNCEKDCFIKQKSEKLAFKSFKMYSSNRIELNAITLNSESINLTGYEGFF